MNPPTPITVSELHRHTRTFFDRCVAGEAFLITRYGVPQAIMRPLTEAEQAAADAEESG